MNETQISKDLHELEAEISRNQKIIDNSHSTIDDVYEANQVNISLKAQRDTLLHQIDDVS